MRLTDSLRRFRRPFRSGRSTVPIAHDPVSTNYGFERGTPADRVYIEEFLRAHADDVRGRVLEVQDATYTRRFGGARASAVDVLDIDPGNPAATIVADLGEEGSLPDAPFDCFVLTETLQLAPRVQTALQNAWSGLAPGEVLLITVPVAAMVWPRNADLWRWTPAGFAELVVAVLCDVRPEVVGMGNLAATTAFLHDLAAEELPPGQLDHHDPRYPFVVTARIHRDRRVEPIAKRGGAAAHIGKLGASPRAWGALLSSHLENCLVAARTDTRQEVVSGPRGLR